MSEEISVTTFLVQVESANLLMTCYILLELELSDVISRCHIVYWILFAMYTFNYFQ